MLCSAFWESISPANSNINFYTIKRFHLMSCVFFLLASIWTILAKWIFKLKHNRYTMFFLYTIHKIGEEEKCGRMKVPNVKARIDGFRRTCSWSCATNKIFYARYLLWRREIAMIAPFWRACMSAWRLSLFLQYLSIKTNWPHND